MQMLIDNIAGIEGRITALRAQLALFNEAHGLDKEAEKVRQEAEKYRGEEGDLKTDIASLQKRKNAAIAATGKALAEKMSTFLTSGKAYFEITEDGGTQIGYVNPRGVKVPYNGLSGGEKAQFEPALCSALGATCAIVEAAEMDDTHLTEMLQRVGNLDNGMQVICSTCHPPTKPAEGWEVVKVGG